MCAICNSSSTDRLSIIRYGSEEIDSKKNTIKKNTFLHLKRINYQLNGNVCLLDLFVEYVSCIQFI